MNQSQATFGGDQLRATLAELDQRISELREEVGRHGDPARPGPATTSQRPPAAPPTNGHAPAPSANGHAPTPAVPDRALDDARATLAQLKRQVEDLLAVREQLQTSAQQMIEEWQRALARACDPSDAPTPAGAAAPPPASHAAPGVFWGTMNLVVEPVADIPLLQTVQNGVAALPGMDRVVLSRFEAETAMFELALGQPVLVIDELRRTLPMRFEAAEVSAWDLRITLLDGPPAAEHAAARDYWQERT